MARKTSKEPNTVSKDEYKRQLRALQIQLVKLQRELIRSNARVLVIVEGRDAAGKDGTIKALTEHMAPRETRIYAPLKPSQKEREQWYFQRFVPHLPSDDEFVIFNRSWYNRAGVERVMGFCTDKQLEDFFTTVDEYETLLVHSGIHIRKYYLDITKEEQKERLEARREDPLKNWKISPIDASAMDKFDDYTKARDEMLKRTAHKDAPWRVVLADHKKTARLALIADLLDSFSYPGKSKKAVKTNPDVVFPWTPKAQKRLAQ
jgi:polyphosphate kinase 2